MGFNLLKGLETLSDGISCAPYLLGIISGVFLCMFIVIVIAMQVKNTGDSQLQDSFMDFMDPLNPFNWNIITQGFVSGFLALIIGFFGYSATFGRCIFNTAGPSIGYTPM